MRARRPGAALVAVAAVGALTGLTACSGATDGGGAHPSSSARPATSSPLNAYEQQRSDGVAALLEQLSSTVRNGDLAGLDRLVDPVASAAFRERMRTAVSAFADADRGRRGDRLRAATLSYRPAAGDGAERQLSPNVAARLEAAGSSDTFVSPVEITYALGGASAPGVDEAPVTLGDVFAFARYGDDWKLVGDGSVSPDPNAADEPSRPAEVGPWRYRGVAAADVRTAGGTSTILSYPGTDDLVGRLRGTLPSAVDAVVKFWGPDWPRRAVLVATGDGDEFAGLTRTRPGDTGAAAAATVFSRLDRRAGVVTGQRIVLSPNARALSGPALAVVIRHELTHVAARTVTAEGAPMWLTEGVAEYVGRKGTYRDLVDAAPDLAAAVAAGDPPKTLPADSAFAVDTERARVAYQSAWSFAAFVADEFGEDRLRALYRGVAKGGDTPTVDAAVAAALGVDKAKAIEGWRAWLRKEVR